MNRLFKRLVVALMAGLSVVVLSCLWGYIPGSTRYHIQETYSFRAGDQDAGIRLAVMIPTTGAYQEVTNVAISWDGIQAREPQRSVEVVKFRFRLVPPLR